MGKRYNTTLSKCCLLFVVVFGLNVVTSAAMAIDQPAPDDVVASSLYWFQDVQQPLALPYAQAQNASQAVFQAVQNNEEVELKDMNSKQADQPRVVAISWTDGHRRARTVFAGGPTFSGALNHATDKVIDTLKDTDMAFSRMRLDIVQSVLVVPAFMMEQGKVPRPTVMGMGFSPDSGLAFLPTQLISLHAIGPERRIRKSGVSRLFIERDEMEMFSRWNHIASFREPQSVFFFETEAYFYNGDTGAKLLFRGHSVPPAPTAERIREKISRNIRFLEREVLANLGEKPDLGLWRSPRPIDLEFEDYAGLALALHRAMNARSGMHNVKGPIDRIIEQLAENMEAFPEAENAACLVEQGRADLSANALFLWLLLATEERTDKDHMALARRIGNYVAAQQQESGYFVKERLLPDWSISSVFSLKSTAQAAYALVLLYETTGDTKFLRASQGAVSSLVRNKMKSASLSQFPVSPWLARAVDALYTHNPADELVVQMRRLAAAVEFSQARNPGYYDLMGARDASPSVFDTTDDAAALAAATRLLKDAGRGVEAASPLRTLFLSLRFTGQLQIGSASSMFLKEPRAYEGAFRENCHQMTVSLSSQWESLLAYTEAEQLLDQTKESFLQRVREELAERLEKNRAQMRTFPAFLDEDMTIDTGVDEKER